MKLLRPLAALIMLAQFSMASWAGAQSIPHYNRAELPIGAAYSWETSEGLSKAINLGFDGQVFRFLITDLATDGREIETLYGTNQQGRLVWYSVNGQTESYEPHDCSFLATRCETEILRNGVPFGRSVTNAYYQSGIWFHTVITTIDGQAPYTTQVCGIHDQDSIFQALYVSYSDTDAPYWMRITSGPNAGRSREMLAQVTAACQRAQPNS